LVGRKINGALAQHTHRLEELQKLQDAFKDALIGYEEYTADDFRGYEEGWEEFFPKSNPSELAHGNAAFSPVSVRRRQTHQDAETRLSTALEEPVLAAQVCLRICHSLVSRRVLQRAPQQRIEEALGSLLQGPSAQQVAAMSVEEVEES
jgi:hypothetical protein